MANDCAKMPRPFKPGVFVVDNDSSVVPHGQIKALEKTVANFCSDRDWDQFHDAKELAIGASTEAAELLELFRFRSKEECESIFSDTKKREQVEDELADVFFFVLRFAQKYAIDLEGALNRKMHKNALKYPIEKSRGSNRKYDEL